MEMDFIVKYKEEPVDVAKWFAEVTNSQASPRSPASNDIQQQ